MTFLHKLLKSVFINYVGFVNSAASVHKFSRRSLLENYHKYFFFNSCSANIMSVYTAATSVKRKLLVNHWNKHWTVFDPHLSGLCLFSRSSTGGLYLISVSLEFSGSDSHQERQWNRWGSFTMMQIKQTMQTMYNNV